MKEQTNKKHKAIALSLMLILFFTLGFMVKGSSEGILFDVKIIEYVHNNTIPGILKFMRFISFVGSANFLLPVTAMIISYTLIKKKYYISKLLLLSTLGSYILNFILKQIFHRTRPIEYFLVKQGGLSFPSGHSMVTMSLYSTIAFLLAKKVKDKGKRRLIYTISFVMICLMGISRIYLGVHWPTDVIGGYLMGYVFYCLSITLVKE
ncbi:phosphatase PAP2 family protein [Tissierella sp. MB52-C2]|uniref:phosphatase PAP2 family protein n=1 Tax=Tissierella sp. MB52-C2 TaxID=3070999 RepID=UPI00280AF87D|nr:phosphatase PAP2 family protein [Tissierella sp. MB52-C2]WMM25611.1 phosphatase PAP2 family protein [Tissierella sp. MB52-C2]